MSVTLTRVVSFSALHRYHVPTWTAEENLEAFGSLGEEPGHGHEYRCSVAVRGPLSAHGTVVDLAELDRILQQEVVDILDQQHINLVLPEFAYGKLLPTCEALAAYFFPRIQRRLPNGVILERLRLAEDATLYADCTGSSDTGTQT